jgi:hypothetical protein
LNSGLSKSFCQPIVNDGKDEVSLYLQKNQRHGGRDSGI